MEIPLFRPGKSSSLSPWFVTSREVGKREVVWRVKYAARELFSRKLAEFIGNSIDRARDRKEIQRAKLAVERRGGESGAA